MLKARKMSHDSLTQRLYKPELPRFKETLAALRVVRSWYTQHYSEAVRDLGATLPWTRSFRLLAVGIIRPVSLRA